jgi:hypothetical protein
VLIHVGKKKKLKGYRDVVNIGRDRMNSHTGALCFGLCCGKACGDEFLFQGFPGLGCALFFRNFNLDSLRESADVKTRASTLIK